MKDLGKVKCHIIKLLPERVKESKGYVPKQITVEELILCKEKRGKINEFGSTTNPAPSHIIYGGEIVVLTFAVTHGSLIFFTIEDVGAKVTEEAVYATVTLCACLVLLGEGKMAAPDMVHSEARNLSKIQRNVQIFWSSAQIPRLTVLVFASLSSFLVSVSRFLTARKKNVHFQFTHKFVMKIIIEKFNRYLSKKLYNGTYNGNYTMGTYSNNCVWWCNYNCSQTKILFNNHLRYNVNIRPLTDSQNRFREKY